MAEVRYLTWLNCFWLWLASSLEDWNCCPKTEILTKGIDRTVPHRTVAQRGQQSQNAEASNTMQHWATTVTEAGWAKVWQDSLVASCRLVKNCFKDVITQMLIEKVVDQKYRVPPKPPECHWGLKGRLQGLAEFMIHDLGTDINDVLDHLHLHLRSLEQCWVQFTDTL